MADLVIGSGDLIGDRRPPRKPKHWQTKNWGPTFIQEQTPHCRHITRVSRNQPQNHLHRHSPPILSIPMSLQNQRVQEDSTAAPFCIMTGTVRELANLQNPPPSPIQDLVTIPVENPSTDFTSQLTKQLTHEISSRESAYGLACALAESAVRNGHTFVAEEDYEDYTAQSPFQIGRAHV